jgi:3-methyl-2-oxobutanoate hydroxymethyltransferase
VKSETAREISSAISIPTIGIGSGVGCDGQVLVVHDLVGLFPWFKPKFVKRKAHVAQEIRAAAAAYIQEVKEGRVLPGASSSWRDPMEAPGNSQGQSSS